MTNDNKPPMFGPSGMFDPGTYELISGTTHWEAVADTFFCTTSFPFKFEFDRTKGKGHNIVKSSNRDGMTFNVEYLSTNSESRSEDCE